METQVNGTHVHRRRWLILLPILWVMLACRFLVGSEAVPTPVAPGPASESITNLPAPSDPPGAATENVPDGPDPLDRVFELRSIQFHLITLQPDGSTRSVLGEIDSAGNMHLNFHSPVPVLSNLPENFDPNLELPEESELYVVDGEAYQPDDQNPAWMTTPVADDYLEELSNLLHGPNGPGLWLDLLPAGSLNPAGQETVGGFAADKYTVNGMVNDQAITGALWYAAHVLVRVELHIPAALSDPDQPDAKGELEITLDVQKAAIPPVALPSPPAVDATSQP